jgi:hypothetical protein
MNTGGNMSLTRRTTNRLIEMMEEGALDPQTLAEACLSYMSEADVTDMAQCNELLEEDEEDDEEEE